MSMRIRSCSTRREATEEAHKRKKERDEEQTPRFYTDGMAYLKQTTHTLCRLNSLIVPEGDTQEHAQERGLKSVRYCYCFF